MKPIRYHFLFLFLLSVGQLFAQNVEVKGRLVDANDQSAFDWSQCTTDQQCRLNTCGMAWWLILRGLLCIQKYSRRRLSYLVASFIGYYSLRPTNQPASHVSPDLGKIQLKPDAQLLKDVIVKGVADRVEQKGRYHGLFTMPVLLKSTKTPMRKI
jgi:hypothetical protein